MKLLQWQQLLGSIVWVDCNPADSLGRDGWKENY
jgi:hypothetical protein